MKTLENKKLQKPRQPSKSKIFFQKLGKPTKIGTLRTFLFRRNSSSTCKRILKTLSYEPLIEALTLSTSGVCLRVDCLLWWRLNVMLTKNWRLNIPNDGPFGWSRAQPITYLSSWVGARNRSHHDRTSVAAMCSTSHGIMTPKWSKSGDRKMSRTGPNSWESGRCLGFFSIHKFSGHCFGTCSGTCSVLARALFFLCGGSNHTVGPTTSTHWRSGEPIFSAHKKDGTRYQNKRQRRRDIDNFRQETIFTNTRCAAHGADTSCFVLSAVLVKISRGLVAAAR